MPRTFQMTEQHMAAFATQQRGRFEDEMVDYFHREYADESRRLGDEQLRELIREGVEKGNSYYIVREVDVARFIQFMVAIAPDFDVSDKTPWARAILTDFQTPAPQKLERIAQFWTCERGER